MKDPIDVLPRLDVDKDVPYTKSRHVSNATKTTGIENMSKTTRQGFKAVNKSVFEDIYISEQNGDVDIAKQFMTDRTYGGSDSTMI